MKLRTEAEIVAPNERALAARRADAPPRRRQDRGPEPRDQYWTLRRSWTGGGIFRPRHREERIRAAPIQST
jgi:hypothetical protein